MKTLANPAVLESVMDRLARLTPESRRRWGTLTPHEMLCHLGDAFEMVLGIRPRRRPVPMRRRPIMKLVGLRMPIRWPHGWPTNPMHDPRAQGTRPTEFASDLARLIAAIERLSASSPGDVEPAHGLFGIMSLTDWQRWAYKHADHHLRQFGL